MGGREEGEPAQINTEEAWQIGDLEDWTIEYFRNWVIKRNKHELIMGGDISDVYEYVNAYKREELTDRVNEVWRGPILTWSYS